MGTQGTTKIGIRGGAIAKNTLVNLAGEVIPIVVGFLATPYVIHGLGVERFGILSIAWVLSTFLMVFDLGLGRATNKVVAEALGEGRPERIPSVVWTSLGCLLVLGAAAGLVLAIIDRFFFASVFKLPTAFQQEARASVYWVSAAVPFLLSSSALTGALQGGQRFDLYNYVRIPSGMSFPLLAVAGVYFGLPLPRIIALQALGAAGSLAALIVLCIKGFPSMRHSMAITTRELRPLVTLGGWFTVVFLVSIALVHVDKLVISSVASVAALTFYMPPFSVVNRLWVLPNSIYTTLFPVFGAAGVSRREELERLLFGSLKHLILVSGPIFILLVFFARDFLRLWLGNEFAEKSTLVLQILAVGFFLNTIAWIPSTLLQGVGRVDLVAKIFVLELPGYVALLWWLVGETGIKGAATAWAIRGGAEAVLFMAVSWRLVRYGFSGIVRSGCLRALMTVGSLLLVTLLMPASFRGLSLAHATLTAGLVALFGLGAYHFAMDESERRVIKAPFLWVTGRFPRC